MLQRNTTSPTVHVMVATPSATTGQGGIDRLMATLKKQIEREGRTDFAVRFLATRGSGSVLLSPFYTAAFCFRMLAARLLGRVNVVHINLASSGSTYRKLIITNFARLLAIPYVLHLHSGEYQSFWQESGLTSVFIHRMFSHASQIVVLGRVWQDFIVRRVPAAADKITIVPNATQVPSMATEGGGESVHILFLGRIGELKGVPQLGEALHRMRSLDGWHATIAGDGAVNEARAKATELGLSERVAIPGWVGPEEVARLIASADILVLPSFVENLPLSVIEGMAAGLAVVTTPVGAVEDIIVHDETGLLVPPGDVDALTQALVRLVQDPDLRRKLGKQAEAVHRERLDLTPFARAIRDVWIAAAR